jgi:hypothetical protein
MEDGNLSNVKLSVAKGKQVQGRVLREVHFLAPRWT